MPNVEELSAIVVDVGLLLNFGMPTFKDGLRRLVNNHQNFASSRLRANKIDAGVQ